MSIYRIMNGIAETQHGVVTRRQLLDAGVTGARVDGQIKRGWLTPLHRGVFQVGPIASPAAREMAAVLTCGPGAVLSHFSAGGYRRIVRLQSSAAVEVIVVGSGRRHEGIRVHRVQELRADETVVYEGIPMTTPARTLLDIAGSVPLHEAELAVSEALVQKLTTPGELRRLIARHAGRRGAAALRTIMSDGPAFTRSEAERKLLNLVRLAALPEPRVNVRVGRYEVDFLWPEERLIVEVDGVAFHSTRRAVERDHRRDFELVTAGYGVLRLTWRQITTESVWVTSVLARTLTWRGMKKDPAA